MKKNIGLIVVGDEILSGRRQDQHLSEVINILDKRHLALSWCRFISDDMQQQVALYKDTLASEDIVFSTGGIGATPDDLSREAAAIASGFELEFHPEGTKIIEARFGDKINDNRRRLVEFPRTSRLIPNPINEVPGFSLYDHHFVPGFPKMAWPMIEWVLDNHYANLEANKKSEIAILVNAAEGEVIALMQETEAKFAEISVFSLPKIIEKGAKRELVLGVKGIGTELDAAMDYIQVKLKDLGLEWEMGDK